MDNTKIKNLLRRWYQLGRGRSKIYQDMDSPHDVRICQVRVNGALRQVGSWFEGEGLHLNAYGPALIHAATLEAIRREGWGILLNVGEGGSTYAQVFEPGEAGIFAEAQEDDHVLAALTAYLQAMED